MVVGTLLSLAAIAAMLAYISKTKGYSPYGPYDAWRRLTEPLRDVNRLIPPAVAVVGWFVGLWLADVTGSFWLTFALMLALPMALVWETIRVGIPTAIGVVAGLFAGFTEDPMPDAQRFVLPMSRIYESKADDVSEWTASAVPIPKDRSILAIGASGAGKTNCITWLVDQLDANVNSPKLVFEMKDDYSKHLSQQGHDMIRLSADGSTHYWNLFRELDPAEPERDAREMSKALMPTPEGKNAYFARAAQDVFCAVLLMFYQREDIEEPTNRLLANYFKNTRRDAMYSDLEDAGHIQAASHLDPESGTAAANVYSGLQSAVSEVLQQDFARDGSFSVREYYAHTADYGGAPLVLDFPARSSGSLEKVYSHLIDDAIMHGLDDYSDRRKYYLLDEIEMLGSGASLENLDRLQNLGRGQNCVSITTLQNVSQLRSSYSKDKANSILSGAYSTIMMRAADQPTVDFYRSRVGAHFEEKTSHVEKQQSPLGHGTIETGRETSLEEVEEFSKGQLVSMEAGEAIVVRGAGQQYVHGRVALREQ